MLEWVNGIIVLSVDPKMFAWKKKSLKNFPECFKNKQLLLLRIMIFPTDSNMAEIFNITMISFKSMLWGIDVSAFRFICCKKSFFGTSSRGKREAKNSETTLSKKF